LEHRARLGVSVEEGDLVVRFQGLVEAALRVAHPDRDLLWAVNVGAAAEGQAWLALLVDVRDDDRRSVVQGPVYSRLDVVRQVQVRNRGRRGRRSALARWWHCHSVFFLLLYFWRW